MQLSFLLPKRTARSNFSRSEWSRMYKNVRISTSTIKRSTFPGTARSQSHVYLHCLVLAETLNLRESNRSFIIAICLPRRRQPISIRGDEICCPQSPESLVAVDLGIGVHPGHDFLEVLAAFGFGLAPEPELLMEY